MKMTKLLELLEGYSGNADVCVVAYDHTTHEKSYYCITGFEALDWGTRFELVVKIEEE